MDTPDCVAEDRYVWGFKITPALKPRLMLEFGSKAWQKGCLGNLW